MNPSDEATRRCFLASCSSVGLSATFFPGVLWARFLQSEAGRVDFDMVRSAARLSGLDYTSEEYALMTDELNKNLERYEQMRRTHIDNSVAPPLYFDPLVPGIPVDRSLRPFRPTPAPALDRPPNLEDVAFWPVTHLRSLIASRKVSSRELTEMYLGRLERLNPVLNCVVTLTPERARKMAAKADEEIAAGHYRGPLQGIPWGAKDIISARGYPTTWGAAPFADQELDVDASVVQRLDDAGAVLIAKLSTGELAFGDTWFGGRTNNPWNPEEGSSGSSAGPGAATAAGCVGFAIGTDTGGSILSPSVRCGVSGLRPTFGRVSRDGVMAAGFSLDKIGPMCRYVEDCALVLHAIAGPDGRDLAVVENVPFNWDAGRPVDGLRVGYLAPAFDRAHAREPAETLPHAKRTLEAVRSLGFDPKPVELPDNDLTYFIEYVERAAGFDEFAREGKDAGLRRERHRGELRASHLVPGVEYLQANRIRRMLMDRVAATMSDLDVILSPWRAINPLTSMTGHPVVTLKNGFTSKGTPTGIALMGQVYGEEKLLVLAKAIEASTDFHRRHPLI